MSLIDKFNYKVNNGKKIDFHAWNQYREEIKQQMEKVIMLNGKGLVMGAGMCQDIPLTYLTDVLNELVLTDVNVDIVNKGIRDHNLTKSQYQKITTKKLEYTGLEFNLFFETLLAKIKTITSSHEIKHYIDKKIEKMMQYSLKKQLSETYDFIYVTPIYTQLIYQQILVLGEDLRRTMESKLELIEFLESYVLEKMPMIIDHFNKNLLSLLSLDGRIFVLSDIFEGEKDSEFIKKLENNINDFNHIEKIHNNYISQYGYGLGDYGLLSLTEHSKVIQEKWFIWPFTSKRYFVVKQITVKKDNN